MAHEHIALALGISRPTLEKHFAHELSVGAYQRRMERLRAMHAAAKSGNVAAAKYCDSLEPKVAVPPPLADEPEAPLGKKQQAQADAQTAQKGTEWEGLLRPPSTVQ